MRITGGAARGIVLDVPKKGEVRPATDFVRERIFGRLVNVIQGVCVLDCFAGTGAYGLEALSRGAKFVCFLEKDLHVAATLRNNCEKVCKSAQREMCTSVKIISTDVFHFDPSRLDFSVDYIFFDPPYRFWDENLDDIINFLEQLAEIYPESRLIAEYPAQFDWTEKIPWKPVYLSNTRKKLNAPEINVFQKR